MGKAENDLARKQRNEHFLKAFKYVSECKGMTQLELATAIHSKSSYISGYRNGIRPVPEETLDALICISATIENGDGQIYKPYLLGLSDYMLLRNVPDEEIIEVERRRNNPDYDIMRRQKSNGPKEPENDERNVEVIISLASTLIKETEEIRRQLSEERKEVSHLMQQLSEELSNVKQIHTDMELEREAIRSIRSQLSSILYLTNSDQRLPMAAENQEQ
jgi:transcriptional regulator with XRE-family HTH domain